MQKSGRLLNIGRVKLLGPLRPTKGPPLHLQGSGPLFRLQTEVISSLLARLRVISLSRCAASVGPLCAPPLSWRPRLPIYFFHMRDGTTLIPDEEGGHFDDVERAANEARESAREWAMQIIMAGGRIEGQSIEMADDQGEVRLSLPLRLVLN